MADVTSSDGHCGTRLHTAWASVLVWTDLTGSRTVIRNGVVIGSIPAGGIAYYDHYPPLGANASYQVSNGTTTSTTAVQPIPADSRRRCWIKSASNPNLSTLVHLGPIGEVEYEDRGATYKIIGKAAPFAIIGGLSARKQQITAYAQTASDRDRLVALLDAGTVCVQMDPGVQQADMWAVGVPRIQRVGTSGGNVLWSVGVALTEVSAPSLPGTIIPGWSWDTVKATWATSNALRSANATGLALVQYGVS